MKKLIVLSCLLAFVSNSFAQVCNPNPAYTAEGFNPTELSGLSPAFPGVYYEEVITLNVPTDTMMDVPGVGYVALIINWWRIDSIRVFTNGNEYPISSINLSYSCEPSQCQFNGGTSGCISISGVPTLSVSDNNDIVIFSTLNVTHPLLGAFEAPQTTFHYIIDDNAHTDVIRGKVYRDENQNCLQDISEISFSGIIITANPGNNIAVTDAYGNYSLSVTTPGTYTVSHAPHPYWGSNCPQPTQSYSVTVGTQSLIIPDNNFGDTLVSYIDDMMIWLTNQTPAKPGFEVIYHINVRNLGTTYNSGTVQLQHDAALGFISAYPSQDTYNGNILSWNYGPLNPGYSLDYTVHFVLDQSTQLGSIIYLNASVNPLAGDTTPWDNSQTLNQLVVGSYDPNIKEVSPEGNIDPLDAAYYPLTYTVHFQNTGTDTAFTVVIRDTISQYLNMETFEVLASSHPVTTSIINPREIMWVFNNILLPDSNVNEPQSHGFIQYRIRVNSILVAGNEIRNTAHIYFDFNEPIATNTTVNSIMMQPGFDETVNSIIPINIFPNPNNGTFTLETNLTSNGIVRAEVRNLFGQLIYSDDEYAVKGQYRKTINMDFASGIYLVTLQTTEGSTTKKIEVVK